MTIGIFSDIHDHLDNLSRVKDIFLSNGAEMAVFCGDLVSPFVLTALAEWPLPIKAVLGNNEGDLWTIKNLLAKDKLSRIDYPADGYLHEISVNKQNIAIYHGQNAVVTEKLLHSRSYDLVCTGHTHQPHIKQVAETSWINPGSVMGPASSGLANHGTVAIYRPQQSSGKIIDLPT